MSRKLNIVIVLAILCVSATSYSQCDINTSFCISCCDFFCDVLTKPESERKSHKINPTQYNTIAVSSKQNAYLSLDNHLATLHKDCQANAESINIEGLEYIQDSTACTLNCNQLKALATFRAHVGSIPFKTTKLFRYLCENDQLTILSFNIIREAWLEYKFNNPSFPELREIEYELFSSSIND